MVSGAAMLAIFAGQEAQTVVFKTSRGAAANAAASQFLAAPALGAASQAIDFDSGRTPLFLSGTIVDDQTGLPLAGAVVTASSATDGYTPQGSNAALADANGNFTVARQLTWPAAEAIVTVALPNYATQRLTLPWGAEGVALHMTRASGVTVQVLDVLTRDPVEGYWLAVVSRMDFLAATAGRGAVPWIRLPGTKHGAGIEWLGDLEQGDYMVTITPFEAAFAPTTPVPIHIGEQHVKETIFVAPRLQATVKVIDAEGRPARSVRVEACAPLLAGHPIVDQEGQPREPAPSGCSAYTGQQGEAVFLLPKGSEVVFHVSAQGRLLLSTARSLGMSDHQKFEVYLNHSVSLVERATSPVRMHLPANPPHAVGTEIVNATGQRVYGAYSVDLSGNPTVTAAVTGKGNGQAPQPPSTVANGAPGEAGFASATLDNGASGCVPCLNGRHGAFQDLGGGTGLTISTEGHFQLGSELSWLVTGTTPNTTRGCMLLGLGTISMPIASVLPQCQGILHVRDPIAIFVPADAAGVTKATLPVPPNQGFCGVRITGQYVELAEGVCPVQLSDAGSILIGN